VETTQVDAALVDAMRRAQDAVQQALSHAELRDETTRSLRARADAAAQLLEALLEVVRRVPPDAMSEDDRRTARLIDHAVHADLPPEAVAALEGDLERLRRGEPLDEGVAADELSAELRRTLSDG
jgi:hypothetical protein